jgi:hypothetical protein
MRYYNNKKLGLYSKYYNDLFFMNAYKHDKNITSILYTNLGIKKHSPCLLIYPIINKKIMFIEMSCKIVKKKGMKKLSNFNQTIILEASISSQKCIYTVPIFSVMNHLFKNVR